MITAIILITTTNEDLLIVPDISFVVSPNLCKFYAIFLPFTFTDTVFFRFSN